MRPTWAEVDLDAIKHNLTQIRACLAPGTAMTAVVKANAYGHGAIPVSRAALAAGCRYLAVAIPEEGAALREAGIDAPIMLLGLTLPEQAALVCRYDLIPPVTSPVEVKSLVQAARRAERRLKVTVPVDTGMSRIGVPAEQALPFIQMVAEQRELALWGIFTHFATADAADKSYAQWQHRRFAALVEAMRQKGLEPPFISAANSAATIDLPDTHYTAVRPGIIMYGLPPSSEMHHHLDLRPAMQFKTSVVYIKKIAAGTAVSYGCTYTAPADTYLATLPVGYADGYNRRLSNQAHVLIGGRPRPVVGRICMDQTMVDIGPVCDVAVGDEVVLFGRQGQEEISVTALADIVGTINYELVCAVSARVPRVYLGNDSCPA